MRPARLIVLVLALLAGAALPGTAAAQTVTLGPALSTSTQSVSCPTSGGTDCAYVNSTEPAGVIAAAPAAGVITTWRVAGFIGEAQLVVVQPNGDGTDTIVGRSAPGLVSCPPTSIICTPDNQAPDVFTTNLPIAAGQLIGVELIQQSGCNGSGLPSVCTQVGTGPAGAASDAFDTAPATGAPAKPDATGGAGMLVNADETLSATASKTVSLTLGAAKITAGGGASTTATATVTDQNGAGVAGESVTITSSDPGQKVGPVTDQGAGHYTATITSSKTVGAATITATDASDPARASATATLAQGAPAMTLSLSPASLFTSVSGLLTVTLTGVDGHKLAGQAVSVATSADAGSGAVRDNGDGTYSAGITAGRSAGTATVKATDGSVSPAVSGSATLTVKAAPTKPKGCVVPKLAGKTVAAARRALRKAGCALGKTTRRKASKVRAGRVISSKPRAHAHRRHGTRVAVVVSRGRH